MLDRHDLASLAPEGWTAALAQLDGRAAELAAQWRDRGWPAVVRRTEPGTPADMACVGLPAPPDADTGQKPRVGMRVPRAAIAAVRPPLGMDEVDVPADWEDAFAALRADLHDAGIECRVFGSLAMQTITGARYLRPTSDIDVLLRPADAAQLDAGVGLLARHAGTLPLDGEIAFPSGYAVSWKEWWAVSGMPSPCAGRVLAKHVNTVALLRCEQLRDQLVGRAHA